MYGRTLDIATGFIADSFVPPSICFDFFVCFLLRFFFASLVLEYARYEQSYLLSNIPMSCTFFDMPAGETYLHLQILFLRPIQVAALIGLHRQRDRE